MYKIVYKNLRLKKKNDPFTYYTGSLENIHEKVLKYIHRYYGNQMEGHGVGEFEIYEVSRKSNDDIETAIVHYQNEMKKLKEEMDKVIDQLKIPYKEVLSSVEKIGSLPTDEELLNEGWSEEQVKNRISIQ